MKKENIPLGILYSTTGTYGTPCQQAQDGALFAVDEINQNDSFSFNFIPHVENPNASINLYQQKAEKLITQYDCRHIIGTFTSISRKEVIPILEKHDGLLWYTSPYEGFESCDNVMYLGPSPNQQIIPMFEYLLPVFGKRGYFVGTNYIWAWEQNRIGRELLHIAGGETLGEKYLAFGSNDLDKIIDDILDKKPDFIVNNFVGGSSYVFYHKWAEAIKDHPSLQPEHCPIVSFNLTESELKNIEPAACEGHLSTAGYFNSMADDNTVLFTEAVKRQHGKDYPVSAYFIYAYMAVTMLAKAIQDSGSADIGAVRQQTFNRHYATPIRDIKIDSDTQHAWHRPLIGRITANHQFDIIKASENAISADPYLIKFSEESFKQKLQQNTESQFLRLVK